MPIGAWVLEQACRQAVRWHDAVARRAAVVDERQPLAPPARRAARSPNDVARVLARHAASPPTALWLEITESTLMHDAESALSALGALRALGVHLASTTSAPATRRSRTSSASRSRR